MISNAYGTWTFFRRETHRFLKVWMQTLIAPVVSNLLYFAIFGISLHRAIPNIQGISYLQFLVPGLIVMGLINNAFQNPSSSVIIMKYQGLINDILSIPLHRVELLVAFIASAVLRALLVGLMTFLTASFFVEFSYDSIPLIFISSLLISLFFAFLGLTIGIWADEFDKTAFVQNFILMPLVFLGGVFYSIESLPSAVQSFTVYNPIFHMINLTRYGFTGVAEYAISTSLWITTISTSLLGLISYLILRTGWRLQN